MPWWWLIERTSPYIGRLIGIQPQPQPRPQPQPQPQPDRYRSRTYDYDKHFGVEEQLISGNRVYERTYNTTPGEKQDTTISVRRYPTGESIGIYRSPYYNGVDNANEPMDVDSWNQVNDKIDAGKRNLILGRQFGGYMPSRHMNEIKNISKNKTYYGGELEPAVVYSDSIYGGELPAATVVAESPTYYGGELEPAVVYSDKTYYGGELEPARVYADRSYYGGELNPAVVYANESSRYQKPAYQSLISEGSEFKHHAVPKPKSTANYNKYHK